MTKLEKNPSSVRALCRLRIPSLDGDLKVGERRGHSAHHHRLNCSVTTLGYENWLWGEDERMSAPGHYSEILGPVSLSSVFLG